MVIEWSGGEVKNRPIPWPLYYYSPLLLITNHQNRQTLGVSSELRFQDASCVAVALWALSDGKALSLRLLVGGLEGGRWVLPVSNQSDLQPM